MFVLEFLGVGVFGIGVFGITVHTAHAVYYYYYYYYFLFFLKACAFDDFFATEDAQVSFWSVRERESGGFMNENRRIGKNFHLRRGHS